MGYTHYWNQPRDLTPAEMTEISDTVAKLIKGAKGVKICGGLGEGKPTLDAEQVWLNGKGPDLDYETFVVNTDHGMGFCKTERRPYDIVVVAALAYLAAKWDFIVQSDGDAEDWTPGVALASKVLGEEIACPIA